jgi:hypothetical protein
MRLGTSFGRRTIAASPRLSIARRALRCRDGLEARDEGKRLELIERQQNSAR